MDRRDFMISAAAVGAAGIASTTALAQGRPGRAAAAAPAAFTGTPLRIGVNGSQLQWLRSPADVGKAVSDMTFDGMSLTVGGGTAHVNVDRVETELPAFVAGLKAAGVTVDAINTSIVDGDATAERILNAAAAAGVRNYTWKHFDYDLSKPIQPQLDALKPRVDRLSKLNQKLGLKAMYTTSAVPGAIGSRVWDILQVLGQFDAKYVSLQFSMADMLAVAGNEAWEVDFLSAGPYIGGVVVGDIIPYLNIQSPQGGPFTGNPADLNRGGFGGGGFGGPGGPGRRPPGAPSGAPSAAPAAAPPPPPPPPVNRATLDLDAQSVATPAYDRASTAPPQPPKKYSVTLDGRPVPTDRGGAGAKVLPWYFTYVPIGTGVLDVPRLGALIKQSGFTGPVEIQCKYPNGGAEAGADKISNDRLLVLGNMKRDQLALKIGFSAAGLVPPLFSLQGR